MGFLRRTNSDERKLVGLLGLCPCLVQERVLGVQRFL
jgi:hypothetical protein